MLPFVSMVTEKAKHLQSVVAPYNRGRPKKQRIQVRFVQQQAAVAAAKVVVMVCEV